MAYENKKSRVQTLLAVYSCLRFDEYVNANKIEEKTGLKARSIRQIMANLRESGFGVKNKIGINGGYILEHDTKKLKNIDIVGEEITALNDTIGILKELTFTDEVVTDKSLHETYINMLALRHKIENEYIQKL